MLKITELGSDIMNHKMRSNAMQSMFIVFDAQEFNKLSEPFVPKCVVNRL